MTSDKKSLKSQVNHSQSHKKPCSVYGCINEQSTNNDFSQTNKTNQANVTMAMRVTSARTMADRVIITHVG